MDYSSRLSAAFDLARTVHAGQKRKGANVPYLTHVMAVAALVGEYGGDEDQMVAALLHDSIEDQPDRVTLTQLQQQFGDRVAELVRACVDATVLPKPPWRERKEQFISGVESAGHDVKLIIAADKLHNAQSVLRALRREGPAVWERFTGRREGSLWYYAAIVHALSTNWSHPILDELVDTVELLHRP